MKLLMTLSLAGALALFAACRTDAEAGPGPEAAAAGEAPSAAPGALSGELGSDDEAPGGLASEAASAQEGPLPEVAPAPGELFLEGAFPPMLPETDAHLDSWLRSDCILCHETGVAGAPIVRHRGMSPLLKQAKCRTCHISASPAAVPLTDLAGEQVFDFDANAFPPTLPMDESHRNPWTRQDCLLCHKWGVAGAPKVRHTGMSELLLQSKCRTCHVPSADANGP